MKQYKKIFRTLRSKLIFSLFSTCLFTSFSALAADPKIVVYEKPDVKSAVVSQLSPNNPIIPFYKEKDWVKVGLPQNGLVGWVNIQAYVQAREEFYRPNLQTVYVQVNSTGDKNNIVAYKNGKKLNDTEATQLYQKLQLQNQQHMKFWLNNAIFYDDLHQSFMTMQGFDHNSQFSAPVIFFQDGSTDNANKNK